MVTTSEWSFWICAIQSLIWNQRHCQLLTVFSFHLCVCWGHDWDIVTHLLHGMVFEVVILCAVAQRKRKFEMTSCANSITREGNSWREVIYESHFKQHTCEEKHPHTCLQRLAADKRSFLESCVYGHILCIEIRAQGKSCFLKDTRHFSLS